MLRLVILILLPFISIFLQSTFFSYFAIRGIIPDILLIFVICYALLNNERRVTLYGFLCGLLEDLYLGRMIGSNALAKGLTAYLIAKLQVSVFKENIMVGIIATLLGTIINSLIMLIIILLFSNANILKTYTFMGILIQSLYNLLLSIPIYIVYYRSFRSGLLRG